MNSKKLITIVVTSFILLAGASFAGKTIQQTIQSQKKQIESLISEVGTLNEKTEKMQKVLAVIRKIKLKNEAEASIFPTEAQDSGDIQTHTKSITSFLLLGTHKKLTDTIILAITNRNTKTLSFISIPRDFSIDGRKINEYYEFFGIESIKKEVEKITNVTIDQYAVIDMDGFEKMIDAIGGLDITVERGIQDYSYPDRKGGYSPYNISKGEHHLDGSEALKYARSRKSTSDFDRSKRQQQILKAIYQKIREKGFGDDLDFIKETFQAISSNLETDISIFDISSMYQEYKQYTFKTSTLLTTDNELYSTRNTKGQYILLPKTGNYESIQKDIQEFISGQ